MSEARVRVDMRTSRAGRRLLHSLAAWWQTGLNRLEGEPITTISPVGAGNSLLDAEALARQLEPGDGSPLEPGDGSPQRTLVEQVRMSVGLR